MTFPVDDAPAAPGPYPRPRRYAPVDVPATGAGRPAVPVVVVGGGPVGLTAALGLAHRGVPVSVLESGDSVSAGSRAICLSRHTLEVLDRLGVGRAVTDVAVPWTGGRSFYRDREVLAFRMPHGDHDVRPPMVNIAQTEVEQVLVDALAALPGVTVHWGATVTGVRQQPDAVVLEVSTPGGTRELRADWVVAADGARSRVRESLGLRMAGTSYEGRYVIADVHWPAARPAERMVWFDPPSNPGSTIIMHRQPHDIWRVDYQLAPDEDAALEAREDRVRARIARHLAWLGDDVPWTLEWSSVYRAHALSLDSYRSGRVLFAGDAAHLVPIFGVRGLNSGVEDAETLAWQLAAVACGDAEPALLDAYAAERRAAWEQNVEAAGKSTRIMTPGSHGWSVTRDAVLALSVSHPEYRQLIDPRQSSATSVRTSPLSWPARPHREGPVPGDPLGDRRVRTRRGGQVVDSSLDAERGSGFAVIGIDTAPDVLAQAVAAVAGRLSHESVRGLLVRTAAAPALPAVPAGIAVLEDPTGTLTAALAGRPGEVLVVRPDGLLLSRHDDAAEVPAAAMHLVAGTAPARSAATVPDAARPADDPRLETAWRELSAGLDAVPAGDREAFLARLALLLAASTPGPAFGDAVEAAAQPAADQRRADPAA